MPFYKTITLFICLTATSLIAQTDYYTTYYATTHLTKFSGTVEKTSNKNKIETRIQTENKQLENNIKSKIKLELIKPFSTKFVLDYIRTINNIEQVQYFKSKIKILSDHNPEKEALKYKVLSKIATDISKQKAYSWLALYFSYRSECERGSNRSKSLVPIINNVVDSYLTNTEGVYGKISKVSKCKAPTRLTKNKT